MSNTVVHKFERDQARIGKYLMGVLSGGFCIPERQFKAIRSSNNRNVRGGFHLSEVYVNQNGAIRTQYRRNVRKADGLALLGEGADGTVFVGHFGSAKNDPVAIKIGKKQSLSTEFKIMKALEKISPHIQHPFIYRTPEQCAFEKTKRRGEGNPLMNSYPKDHGILYSEYAAGGNLRDFVTKYGKALTPAHIKSIVFQVVWTLYAISKKYPSFRHSDLLLDNIFIDNTQTARGFMEYKPNFVVPVNGLRVIIGDFANSHIDQKGMRNPYVTSGQYKNEFGIFQGMSQLYDVHLFLTQFDELVSALPAADQFRVFFKECIPKAYMPTKNGKSNKLTEQRLRANSAANKDIPPLFGMLKHPYFSEYKVEALSGTVKYRWPRNASINMTLKSIKPKFRRVVRRPLINEKPINYDPEFNELKVGITLGERMKKNTVEEHRRKALINALVREKRLAATKFTANNAKKLAMNKDFKELANYAQERVMVNAMVNASSLSEKNARNLVMREARGEFLPKLLARPTGFAKAIIPKMARSLNRTSPKPKKTKKTGSAPTVINTAKVQRKKKIPLNRRRFLLNNQELTLAEQLMELRKRGIEVPENMKMNAPVIKTAPKAKKTITKAPTKGFGPPANMSISKQKRWWKEQLSTEKGYLTIGGKKCDAHPVAVVKTVMMALGKKAPPKASKADLCRLIQMSLNNSNSNSNNNNNNNNTPVVRKRASPVARKARTPITLEEARKRLRNRTETALAARGKTKILRVKPSKVFPL